jgi:hypothetical protein
MKLAAACVIVGTFVVGRPSAASAQAPPAVVTAVQPSVGKSVFVTDTASVEKRGRLVSVDASSLTLLGADQKWSTVRPGDVVRVDVRTHPLLKGAIIGALAGATIGLSTDLGGSHNEAVVGFTVVSALLGAGINELFFPGRHTVFRRP